MCLEIINATDSASTSMTNTILINSADKKVRYKKNIYKIYKIDCYILHTFSMVILLLIIAIIWYHL